MTPRRYHRRPARETPARTVPRLAARPRRGRGRCYLPRALPLRAGTALLATAAAARRPPAEGLVTATSVHRARPRLRRRPQPRSPPPSAARRPRLAGAIAPSRGQSRRRRREGASRCLQLARRTLPLMEWGIEDSFEVLSTIQRTHQYFLRVRLCGTERQFSTFFCI